MFHAMPVQFRTPTLPEGPTAAAWQLHANQTSGLTRKRWKGMFHWFPKGPESYLQIRFLILPGKAILKRNKTENHNSLTSK